MQQLIDSSAIRDDSAALRERLDRDSYLFFRRLLSPERIEQTRRAILAVLQADGWLDENAPLDAARPSELAEAEGSPPSEHFLATYAKVQRLQTFHEVALEPALFGLAETVLGGSAFTFPMKVARLGVPTSSRRSTPAHQDFPIIRGDVDVLTAWVPFGDCARELGGLRVLPGSHGSGVLAHHPTSGVGATGLDVLGADPAWAGTDYLAGDVLLFHSLTVHGALPNTVDHIRLSGDFRFQRVDAPVREVWMHPHFWPGIPDYDELTQGWTSRRSVEPPEGVGRLPEPGGEPPPARSKLVTVEQREV